MKDTKKRRQIEIYKNYWNFTAAHLDITGTKFNNCLKVIILFIKKNQSALQENSIRGQSFADSDLYKKIQTEIVDISGFKGKHATLSARKVINQFVKIGFIYPMLLGYHPSVKKFLLETNREKKQLIFSKIFYESSSLASDVTVDNRDLLHVNFLLKTLDKNGSLNKKDIIALMVTDIRNYSAGYLTREQLDLQYQFAKISGFDERKYNQIGHLIGYLKRFADLKYDINEERFWFVNDPQIAGRDFEESFARDGVKHRIYKDELREESRILYKKPVCYLDKKPYTTLIASHIKPCGDCLREHRPDQAYDVNNGLLLSPTTDSLFDKKHISFTDEGRILIGNTVSESIRADLEKYSLDKAVLNESRKKYLAYHRKLFEEKNGDSHTYKYIDLFCGAGGLSLGFSEAGFENIFSVESHPDFAKTYKKNFPDHNLIVNDIKNIGNEQIDELIGGNQVDVIIGGPPCQGFSIAGNIGRTFLDDERNYLFNEFVRFVSHVKPKMFIMENVAAMATHLGGSTINLIEKAFEKAGCETGGCGYNVKWKVLNSVNFGVAQERRRIVIVGVRKDLNTKFTYPPESQKIYKIKDVIWDLPALKSGETSDIPNHTAMNHTAQMLEKMSYIKDGGNRNDIPERIRPKSGDIRKYIRYDSKKPSVCVTGDMRKIFHYEQNRALTSRELARIQSFPDDFIFAGSSIQIQQQIGNAVPPKLANQLALQVEETLDNVKLS